MTSIKRGIFSWLDRDAIILSILLIASVLFINFLPGFSKLFYIVILILFFRSKRDYLYFVYIFILTQLPFGLFAERNSFINLTPTVEIPFVYIFILIAGLKHWNRFLKYKIYFKELRVILFYFIFLFFISFFHEVSARSILAFIFAALSLLFFLEIFVFIQDKAILLKTIKLLFFTILFLFVFQLYYIISNFEEKGELVRIIWSGWISFITLMISLYHLIRYKNKFFSYNYLYLIAGISFMSVFLTATRGYILQYFFIIFIFLIISGRKFIGLVLAIPLLIIVISFIFPPVQNQLKLIVQRLNTLENLYEGDKTASGTLIRITERAPRVWNKYLESPVIGFGFSDEGYEYNDGHVGNYTLLLQSGVIGLLLYIYVIFSFIKRLFMDYIRNKNHLANIIIVAAILSLIIAHSSSSIFFNYYFEPAISSVMGFIVLFIQKEVYDL